MTILGSILVIISFFIILRVGYFFRYQNGRERIELYFASRQVRSVTFQTLPEELSDLKSKIANLAEHTGYTWDDHDNQDDRKKYNEETDDNDKSDSAGTADLETGPGVVEA